MRISRFWTALDQVIDGMASRYDWSTLLLGEFAMLVADEPTCRVPFIRSAGMFATSVSCPRPGGDGCPRRIFEHEDGAIRAICGDKSKSCVDLDLNRRDAMVYSVDLSVLAHSISRALVLAEPKLPSRRETVYQIGLRDLESGHAYPVLLALPDGRPDVGPVITLEGRAETGPRMLLVPTSSTLKPDVLASLERQGISCVAMDSLFDLDDQGQLRPLQPLSNLFSRTDSAIVATPRSKPEPAWPLAPDARWEELTVRFVAESTVNISFRGQTRAFDYVDLGMRNAKNGKPDRAWAFLSVLAQHRGRLPLYPHGPTGISKYQKQKQSLSAALKSSFGLRDEPIQAKNSEYVSRFTISAADLRQGMPDQSQRNFVGRTPGRTK